MTNWNVKKIANRNYEIAQKDTKKPNEVNMK